MRESLSPPDLLAEIVLYVLGVVLLVFGFFYLLEPSLSVSSINAIAVALGLHLPPAPTDVPDFSGWLGFTFAYMMGATFCAFQAARIRAPERIAYVNVLLLLKATSSLTGLGFFLGEHEYPFYLATFLIDGLIFGVVLYVRTRLTRPAGGKEGCRGVGDPDAAD